MYPITTIAGIGDASSAPSSTAAGAGLAAQVTNVITTQRTGLIAGAVVGLLLGAILFRRK